MTKIPVVYVKGQYNHLIVRNLKELGVESKLLPPSVPLEQLESMNPDALVMGGGPQSVRSPDHLTGELADVFEDLPGYRGHRGRHEISG